VHFTMLTPRYRPEWFKSRSLLGYGVDWPFGWDDLEPYYEEAEDMLQVSGPLSYPWGRRRGRYPRRAHELNAAAIVLARGCERMGTLEGLKHMFPYDRVAAVAVGNRQHEIPGRIDSGDDKCVLGAWNRRHDVAADHCLQRGHDAHRTWTAVVDGIPAVPARTTAPHLRDPRPHLFGRRINGDGVGRREDGGGNHRVAGKRTALVENGRNARGERHNEMDGAFAVPA
jgi:choline dehydrogenase-like flavoprotein